MPRLDETEYRQFKAAPTEWEHHGSLSETWPSSNTTGKPALVALLALLKTFQYLRSWNFSLLKPCCSPKEEV